MSTYISVLLHEPEVLGRLREQTAQDPMARMQNAPEQDQLMALPLQLTSVRQVTD